jgi:hypothetical protein
MSKTTRGVVVERQDSESTIPDDDCFDLLSNNRRRYTLHYLQHNGEQATLGGLSEQIAAWENEIEVEKVSSTQRKRIYTSLQQVHLPRMDRMGAVEFDDRAGVVTLGPTAEDLDVYLEVVRGRGVPWSQFYPGLAAVNLALLAVVSLDAAFLTAVSDLAWGVFVATTFLVAGVCHYYISRREMLLGGDRSPPEVDR